MNKEQDFIPMRLVCIKPIWSFEVGNQYEYWSNFGGLNHLVKDNAGEISNFDGPGDDGLDIINDTIGADNALLAAGVDGRRLYIFDYFMHVQQWRDKQLDKVI